VRGIPLRTVMIDVSEELNRMVSLSHLMPMTNVDVIEQVMLQLREDPSNAEGAKVALDLLQAVRELKSASLAYSKFILELAERVKRNGSSGDAST
jgi:hypothetical protein